MKKFLVLATFMVSLFGFVTIQTVSAKKPAVEPVVATVYDGDLEGCLMGHEFYSYELMAGQTNYAGYVTLSTDGETLYLKVYGDFYLDAGHVYIYEEGETLPSTRPVPGLAPYKLEDINEMEAELEIPLTDVDSYVLAIHVAFIDVEEVGDGHYLAGETAYAADQDPVFNGKGAWFYLVGFKVVECEDEEEEEEPVLTNETAWAFGGYEMPGGNWGWYNYIDEGYYIFQIYAAAGQNDITKGTHVGYVEVSYNGGELICDFIMFEGFQIIELHIYAQNTIPTKSAPGQFEIGDDLEGFIYLAIHLVVEGEY